MSVVANIAVNVDSTKAVGQLQAIDRAATGLSGNTGKLQQAFGGLNTALAGLGLGALIKDLAGAGIDADRTDKRIQGLAGSSGEAGKVFSIAAKAAKEFGISNLEAEKGMADLYGRLRPAGIALKDIETVYYGVNKAALAAGLTSADTSGVFLQLSQALGSGALQGDELRSIMEQMPAVGQAVAKVMGVTVGEVKKLGSEGKITTEVMIKAAAELNKLSPPPPDPFKVFNAEMENLRVEIGENILPILTPFVQLLVGVAKAFGAMPEPLQTVIVALGLAATAILAIGTAAAVLTPVIAAFKTLAVAVGAANIGGIIAGWLPVVATAMSGITAALSGLLAWIGSTLIPGLLAFFSGPVGWTVLAVAAVVAMVVLFRKPLEDFVKWLWNWGEPIRKFWMGLFGGIGNIAQKSLNEVGKILDAAFKTWLAIAYQVWVKPWANLWNNVLRDPVTAAIKWIQNYWNGISQSFTANVTTPISKAWAGATQYLSKLASDISINVTNAWKGIGAFFNDKVVTPISNAWKQLVEFLPNAMNTAGETIKRIFAQVGSAVKVTLNAMLRVAFSAVNSAIERINSLIRAANAISAKVKGPQFGTLPTLRIPQFAEGGVVNRPTLAMVGEGGEREYIIPESKMAATAANYLNGARGDSAITNAEKGGGGTITPVINIQTGPVVEMNGERYVSMADLERAMRKTANSVYASLRTPSSRIALGRS